MFLCRNKEKKKKFFGNIIKNILIVRLMYYDNENSKKELNREKTQEVCKIMTQI